MNDIIKFMKPIKCEFNHLTGCIKFYNKTTTMYVNMNDIDENKLKTVKELLNVQNFNG